MGAILEAAQRGAHAEAMGGLRNARAAVLTLLPAIAGELLGGQTGGNQLVLNTTMNRHTHTLASTRSQSCTKGLHDWQASLAGRLGCQHEGQRNIKTAQQCTASIDVAAEHAAMWWDSHAEWRATSKYFLCLPNGMP